MALAPVTYFSAENYLADFSYFDVGMGKSYFNREKEQLAANSWLSAVFIPLLTFLRANRNRKVSLALHTHLLNAIANNKELLLHSNELVTNGQIEWLASPAFDSMSMLFNADLFGEEVKKQRQRIAELFGKPPEGFINSAMIFSTALALRLFELDFTYAVAPRIPWYIKNSQQTVFRARENELRLILPESSADDMATEPARVIMTNDLLSVLKIQKDQWSTLSEIAKTPDSSVYHVPDLVAEFNDGSGIDTLLGNNMQRDFLAKLTYLSGLAIEKQDDKVKADIIEIASTSNFTRMSMNRPGRFDTYASLLNILYDIEVRLR